MKRLLIAILLGLAACGGDSSGPEVPNMDGTWSILTINGFPMPYAISDLNGTRTEVVSDAFTISGSTFLRSVRFRYTTGSTVTEQTGTANGKYSWDGRAVFTFSDSTSYWGTLDAQNRLNLHWGISVGIYQRQ